MFLIIVSLSLSLSLPPSLSISLSQSLSLFLNHTSDEPNIVEKILRRKGRERESDEVELSNIAIECNEVYVHGGIYMVYVHG